MCGAINQKGGSKQNVQSVMMVMMSGTGEGDLCRAMHVCWVKGLERSSTADGFMMDPNVCLMMLLYLYIIRLR